MVSVVEKFTRFLVSWCTILHNILCQLYKFFYLHNCPGRSYWDGLKGNHSCICRSLYLNVHISWQGWHQLTLLLPFFLLLSKFVEHSFRRSSCGGIWTLLHIDLLYLDLGREASLVIYPDLTISTPFKTHTSATFI